MRKLGIFLVLFLLSPLFFTGFAYAQENAAMKVIRVDKNQVIEKSFLVKAGEAVEISGKVNGEVILAGGQILVDGVIEKDLIVAGGMVRVTGDVLGDLRVAGGQIVISGTVGGNVIAMGGNIEVSEGAKIGGGVIALGGDVYISSEIPQDLIIMSGSSTINSKVGGSAEVFGGIVRLSSGAVVSKDFVYTSENEALISEGASISGQIIRKPTPEWMVSQEKRVGIARNIRRFNFGTKLLGFFSSLAVGLILVRLFPNLMQKKSEVIEKSMGKSLLNGLLCLVLTPIAIVLLAITVIGIPLSLITLVFYIVFIYFSKLVVSYWLGMKVFSGSFGGRNYLLFSLGLLLYYVVTSVPFIGSLAGIFGLLVGLGAEVVSLRELHKSLIKAKTV